MATRIKEKYLAEAIPALEEKFGYKNAMQVPKLAKIVINMGLGDCKDNAKAMEMAVNELTTIAGQKPMITKAKKSIANFKVREGMNVGAKVTLRGARMEEFMDKLVSVALPRVRDFRGVSAKAFDGRGNYSLGIREQLLFPEPRTAAVPRNRVRQGGEDPRNGNRIRDDCAHGRRVQGAAEASGHALRGVRGGGQERWQN